MNGWRDRDRFIIWRCQECGQRGWSISHVPSSHVDGRCQPCHGLLETMRVQAEPH